MAFEIGEEYVFRQNDFEISRETGKLYFLVHDPASSGTYRVKPFDFQATALPEKLTCVYRGDGKFEQKISSVIPQLYKPGETYKFRVMRIDNTSGQLSLRDDTNGINLVQVNLGKHRFQRFQRITCRVTDTTGGELSMTYIPENAEDAPFLTLDEFTRQLPDAAAIERHKVISSLLKGAPFGETRMQLKNKDVQWLLTALDVIDSNLPQWARANLHLRMPWFDLLRRIVISLIEDSPYLNMFPREERGRTQERLSAIVRNCEDSLHAAQLIVDGEEEEVITSTLSSLSRSGWLYNPEKKMRTMMAIFNFRPSVNGSYIDEVFRIIKVNHNEARFAEVFCNGFIEMLNIYINHESKLIEPHNRDSLRKLAEAIALELLLTANRDFSQWNNHRGLLYTIALLLVRKPDPAVAIKAVEAFAQRLDTDLEYTWRDLDDITRLCYTKLATPLRAELRSGSATAFEGDAARVTIDNRHLTVSPVMTGTNTKTAFSGNIGDRMSISVMLNGRLTEKFLPADTNLRSHHLFWNDLEKTLLDKDLKPTAAIATMTKVKTLPEPGTEVTIRITSRDADDEHTFHCVIEDENYQGEGYLTTRDIVQYPVKAFADTFCFEGKPMLLKATIDEVDSDGRCHMYMRVQATEEALRMANNDRDSEDAIKAVITGGNDKIYLAVTNGGYPVSIYRKPGSDLPKNTGVWVVIDKVSYTPAKDTLFISAHIDSIDEESQPEVNYTFVKESFNYLLQELSERRTYTPQADSSDATDSAEPEESAASEPDSYLSAREITYISLLFDGLSLVSQTDLVQSYTHLAIARLLVIVSGDLYRAGYLALKMSLVEALSTFAINGRIDKSTVDELARRCAETAPGNSDIAYKLEMLRTLALIDRPVSETMALAQLPQGAGILAPLRRIVISYNLMRGLGMDNLRKELITSIFGLLNLPMPSIDITKINETEDQHNEFKESLIYPASNNMLPDEKRQVRELMEVTCGFLNTEGGTLYIGVNNQGLPRGLANDFTYLNNGFAEYDLTDARDKFNLIFCKGLRDHFGVTVDGVALYPGYVTLEHEEIDGKPICRVNIKPFPAMVRMTDGAVFVRQDTSTVPIKTQREQTAFARKRLAAKV